MASFGKVSEIFFKIFWIVRRYVEWHETMRRRIVFLHVPIFLWVCIIASTLQANEHIVGVVDKQELDKVHALLSVPEAQIDFAQSKLMIDRMIDPSVDIEREMARLDEMIQVINAKGLKTNMEKKDALRQYLYKAGHWNQHNPFTYDFSDPKGTKIKNKLLGNYLDSRKGNCISMPFLFIALGQKLGLDVTASTAPLHVFVKFIDESTGQVHNLETTSGGNIARDSWLRKGFPMSDIALERGIYLQVLNKRETIAVMANTLLQHYYEEKRFGQLIATADLILNVYPKAISSLIYKAAAYNALLKIRGLWKYRKPEAVPSRDRQTFRYLVSRINKLNNYAMELGWRPPNQADEDAYFDKVKTHNKN
ncbi:MAG: transglutaminase family protein [Sneathiella sp.]